MITYPMALASTTGGSSSPWALIGSGLFMVAVLVLIVVRRGRK